MQKKFEKEIFNVMYDVIPMISLMFNDNVGIGLTDRENYIYFKQGKNIKLPIDAGYSLTEPLGAPAIRVFKSGKMDITTLPKQVTPTDNTCYFFPIRENDEIVGALGVAID